jgi:hypothetical protein
MKKINLFGIYTNSYSRIFTECFFPSIKDEFNSIEIECLISDSKPGHVGTPPFKGVNAKKLKSILEKMKSHKDNILIVSDLDVIFFRKCGEMISNYLEDNDIVLSDNGNDEYNVGFMAMNCNERMIDFWEGQIIPKSERMSEYIGDQPIVNECLKNSNVKHSYLPKIFWTNPVPYEMSGEHNTTIDDIINRIPDSSVTFHATAVANGEEGKFFVLSEIFKNKIV